jgi:hypothetical protein
MEKLSTEIKIKTEMKTGGSIFLEPRKSKGMFSEIILPGKTPIRKTTPRIHYGK